MDHKSIRSNNLSLVFRELLQSGPRSRAALARDTGLNKTTVSSLVAELIERRMLVETVVIQPKMGRPAQMVDVNGDRILGLGLQISADYVAVCLKDLFGRVIAERFETADNRSGSADALARRLGALGEAVLRDWLDEEAMLAGATVAVPGLVDTDAMTVLRAPGLALEHAAIGEAVARELGATGRVGETVRVRVENDANLGAIAELQEGAGRDLSEFVYVAGGTGISAGIVVEGHLLRGAEGFAGELGHLVVVPDGPECDCGGRGCLEAVVRERLVALVGTERFAASPSDTMNVIHEHVAAGLRDGDPAVAHGLEALADDLGCGLAAVVNLLNPQAIVLGGYLSVLGDWLLEPAEARMRSQLSARDATDVQLRIAVLGGYGPLRGAALDALRHVTADPLADEGPGTAEPSTPATADPLRDIALAEHRRSVRRLARSDARALPRI